MSAFINSLASSLLTSSILVSGVTPVLAQYSCPSREIQSVHEVGDLKFELQSCQRLSKKVTCSLWVTNTTKDASAYVSLEDTRLVDTSGEQYKSSVLSNIPLSLVKDVPIKISATFVDVPISVQNIALFEIVPYIAYSPIKGQLRNIKITEYKVSDPSSSIKKKK